MTSLLDPGSRRRAPHRPDAERRPPAGILVRLLGLHVLLPVLGWIVLLAGCGWLLAHPLKSTISGEDGVNRWFVSQRTPTGNAVTNVLSHIGNTSSVIISMLVAAAVIWWISRRWREPIALIAGVSGQALAFLLTTLLIDRPRPQVPKLDQSPPTSSFPSGHTGAATALYFGLVIICLHRVRHPVGRWAATIGFGILPFVVLTARLYRGMHHPTDVAFGMVNGLVCAVIAHRAMHRPT